MDGVGKTEQFLSKDFAEMTKEEAVYAVNQMEFYELSSAEVTISVLKTYVRWCKDNMIFENYVGGFLQASVDDIDPSAEMAKLFFRDEHDFLYSLRKLREFNELHNDVVALVFIWIGIPLEKSVSIRDRNVDLETRKIYDEDGTVIASDFSDDILSILQQYRNTKTATRYNGTTGMTVMKDLSHDGFIKRVCTVKSSKLGEKVSDKQMSCAIGKLNQKYVELGFNPRFFPKNVQRSGALYRLWLLEQTGIDISDKGNATIVEETYGSKQYRSIKWQYKYYKIAFNL